MATYNEHVALSGSTMYAQEEEYKYKYEYYQPKFNTLIKLNNVPFFVINLKSLIIGITRLQTVKTIL